MLRFSKKIRESFWLRVRKTPTCWIWTGPKFSHGYGKCSERYGSQQAHRASWMLTFGKIPRGLCVCHHCDVRDCVNPSHLFLGTIQDNNLDMNLKGRRGVAYEFQLPHTKLSDFEVRRILQLSKERISQRELGKRFGVDSSTISRILSGHRRGRVTLRRQV